MDCVSPATPGITVEALEEGRAAIIGRVRGVEDGLTVP
jgi:hypothetical protein